MRGVDEFATCGSVKCRSNVGAYLQDVVPEYLELATSGEPTGLILAAAKKRQYSVLAVARHEVVLARGMLIAQESHRARIAAAELERQRLLANTARLINVS